jgi:hypothetical protein
MLRQINSSSPERRLWLKRYVLKRQALQPFPRGLVQRVPSTRGVMFLLMQKER